MQIVIDIPEELKNKIDNANEDNYKTYIRWFETTLYYAIKNGTPLPQEHEDFIDGDKIMKIHGVKSIPAVLNAPIIIESDKQDYENDDYYKGAQEDNIHYDEFGFIDLFSFNRKNTK